MSISAARQGLAAEVLHVVTEEFSMWSSPEHAHGFHRAAWGQSQLMQPAEKGLLEGKILKVQATWKGISSCWGNAEPWTSGLVRAFSGTQTDSLEYFESICHGSRRNQTDKTSCGTRLMGQSLESLAENRAPVN
ncbi:unnamed protein product [Caretta caretta]